MASFNLGGTVREDLALIDSSAAIALFDEHDGQHEVAKLFYDEAELDWAALNITAHETFTRLRYGGGTVAFAFQGFDFLRTNLTVVDFQQADELRAREILAKYHDHRISHHDAICAAAMMRVGIYKIFAFDRDFQILGFQVLP